MGVTSFHNLSNLNASKSMKLQILNFEDFFSFKLISWRNTFYKIRSRNKIASTTFDDCPFVPFVPFPNPSDHNNNLSFVLNKLNWKHFFSFSIAIDSFSLLFLSWAQTAFFCIFRLWFRTILLLFAFGCRFRCSDLHYRIILKGHIYCWSWFTAESPRNTNIWAISTTNHPWLFQQIFVIQTWKNKTKMNDKNV